MAFWEFRRLEASFWETIPAKLRFGYVTGVTEYKQTGRWRRVTQRVTTTVRAFKQTLFSGFGVSLTGVQPSASVWARFGHPPAAPLASLDASRRVNPVDSCTPNVWACLSGLGILLHGCGSKIGTEWKPGKWK